MMVWWQTCWHELESEQQSLRPVQPWRAIDFGYCGHDDDDDGDVDNDDVHVEEDNDDEDGDLPPGATPAFTRFHLARRFWNQIFT